ncbi:AT-rich interactive domain-containing protein 6-like isoform X2 [Populus alba x Populus x berolinensis]|nr:AT-rich interactive domain-containing protein 6-like isoform X2 [Populus alba x Populus x berolinensis]
MEDSEIVAVQDLPGDSDANKPSDATVKEQEETADVSEDQEPNENRQASVADDDNTVSLATDVPMTDTPALPDDGKTATDENINRRVVEEKTDGDDGSSVQNQPQTATPSTQRRCSSSRTKLDGAAKSKNVWTDIKMGETDVAGTLEEQAAFMKDLEIFYKQNVMDFKPPKFYGEPLNCLKLWRSVIKLGGYEVVTANKLWRQVGESFHPPKTCTTVSWTFRIFYEKALLEYEKNKREIGELQLPSPPLHQATSVEKETSGCLVTGSGRARRDAAARAMEGWHAQHHLGHGEVKSLNFSRREKPLKSFGFHKQKTDERPVNAETDKEVDTEIIDIGPPADWVKINVWESKDCYEIYALVPGLLREEVRVQSDPVGRLVITGQPEQLDNPWGITPFKKVVSLPSRIDPLQTSAVVSLHGQLHDRAPFENRSA